MLMIRFMAAQVFLILMANIGSTIADCQLDPLETKNAPLPVASNGNSILYPNHGQTTVSLKAGESIDFACPGGKVVLNSLATSSLVQATCVSGKSFKIQDKQYLWSEIHCNTVATAISRFAGGSCGGSGKEAEIGFNLENGKFIRQIFLCFDSAQEKTLYTQYDIISSIDRRSSGTPRPFFQQDSGFYHVGSVNNLFLRGTQRTTINKLLGLASNSEKYIQNGQLYFLARGHLAARTDFYYPAQLNATFKYINTAPQWQCFNAKNWAQAEIDSRNYASSHNVTLKVWTGTYGIATLPHEQTNKDVELYLYAENNEREIPVPAMYWKLVYNPVGNKAVVLIGLNNPYEKNVSKHIICPDISSKISWLKWNKASIESGYSYACSLADFRKVVSYAPSLSISGLLV